MNRIFLHVITISNGLFVGTSFEGKEREYNSQLFLLESLDWKLFQILIHCYYFVSFIVIYCYLSLFKFTLQSLPTTWPCINISNNEVGCLYFRDCNVSESINGICFAHWSKQRNNGQTLWNSHRRNFTFIGTLICMRH